ncbi:dihydroorotase [Blautia schinkii]|nr:dihydroorotase [Blautia schinkii]
MGILIRGGRIIDAASSTDMIGDIYLDEGVIKEIGEKLEQKEKNDRVIEAKGCLVMPGLVDLHVHFRDPGQEYKEDIETGAKAAARGGVTTVVAMPNTTPVIDSPDRVSYVHNKAAQVASIHVLQAGAVTRGEKGEELSDIAGMAQVGIPALSEDGKSVMNSRLYKEAMEQAVKYDLPIFAHCEDIDLRGNGCMNDDENAIRLRLPGICNATEDAIAARDILLALETGVRLHLCHCSTLGVARMMEFAKAAGMDNVTAEVCPHHFILTSDDIERDDPNYKMNPPLRTKNDVEALLRALKNGAIQVISTDHAPHGAKDKTGSMRSAAFGIVGLETSFALTYTELVEKGVLTIQELVEKMSWNPAKILGLDCGTLQEGHPADVIVVDVDHEYAIDKTKFASKGRNTPFNGWKVKGKVLYTICGGKVVYKDNESIVQE